MPSPQFDLCVITRRVPELGRSHVEVARAALEGGATIIQLRDKEFGTRALFEVACELRRMTREYGAALVVNDRVDVALAAEADGVHLGADDLPIRSARRILGADAVIGASVDNTDDARAAESEGATYLGVGPVFPTGSKPDAREAIGIAPVEAITTAVALPVLAIGGLNCDNIGVALRGGARGIAVISAVAESEDMVAAARALRQEVLRVRGRTAG